MNKQYMDWILTEIKNRSTNKPVAGTVLGFMMNFSIMMEYITVTGWLKWPYSFIDTKRGILPLFVRHGFHAGII